MRGDQPARKWRAIRANEAGPNGLAVGQFVKREQTAKRETSHAPASPPDAKLSFYSRLLPRKAAKLVKKRIFTLQTPKAMGFGWAAMFPRKKGPLRGELCLVGYEI